MKKGIGLILALALCLTVLSGCGSVLSGMLGGDENNGNGDSQTGYAQDGYAEGRMGDTMHTVFFDYTVNSAYLCDSFEGYAPSQEGFRLLVAEVTVLNTFQESIPMYDTDFQVQWGDDEDEDAYCVWRAEFSPRRRVCTYGMDIFRLEPGGLWSRGEEVHEEYAYEPAELEAMLGRAGFSHIRQYGELKFRAPLPGEGRIFFAARKEF